VQGHFGEAGSLFGVRGGAITGARRGPFVKDRISFGEWDRYEITNKDGNVTVLLNGKLVNQGSGAKPSQGNVVFLTKYNGVHWVEGFHEFADLISDALTLATKRPAVISDIAGRFSLDHVTDAYRLLESEARGKVLVLPNL